MTRVQASLLYDALQGGVFLAFVFLTDGWVRLLAVAMVVSTIVKAPYDVVVARRGGGAQDDRGVT